jgi:hypothetical protein
MNNVTSLNLKVPAAFARSSPGATPKFGRLPVTGLCPWTSLSRGTLLNWDRLGLIHLVRIRRPGLKRGVVLVPLAEVFAFIDSHAA